MLKSIKVILHCFLLIISLSAFSATTPHSSISDWLTVKTPFAYQKILNNISPRDGLKGVVLASPSRQYPNYYYHWVRDAALVMDSLLTYDLRYANAQAHDKINQLFKDYLEFNNIVQHAPSLTGLGEPKFNVDGSAFNGEWARPQNDGPALRSISLIHWANLLIKRGQLNFVKEKMYRKEFPATLAIKKDLEYVAHHWKDPSFDLWEEIKGTHFYTLMVSRRALLEGAQLANQLDDTEAARYYSLQAKEIETELNAFWDTKRGYFAATINRTGGIDYKVSQLDTSIILGLLHGDMHDGFLAWDNPKVVATMNKLAQSFRELYSINKVKGLGVAIGRYPEDKYGGIDFNGGNPWVLCTLAFAEGLYHYAEALQGKNMLEAAQKTRELAAQYVLRVKYHAYPDGSLSEQIHRNTGYMTSANNLSWNYAAIISTRAAKEMR